MVTFKRGSAGPFSPSLGWRRRCSPGSLVEISDGFAGSDLEAAVGEVTKEAILKGDNAIDHGFWRKVFTNTVPLSKTNPEAIDAIRSWGRERAVPASGVSPSAADASQPRARRAVLV